LKITRENNEKTTRMAKFEKENTTGNRFSSNNQPPKNGRKQSIYKSLKELTGKKVEYELSKEDYFKMIRFLLEQSKPTLEEIMEDANNNPQSNTPIWVCNIIRAIMMDTKKGITNTVEMLFDRLFGKSMQPVDHTTNGKDLNTSIQIEIIDRREQVDENTEDTDNESI